MNDSKTTIPIPSVEVVETIPVRNRIMFAALLPAMIMSVIFFGVGSITIMLEAILSCLLFEYLVQKYLLKIPTDVRSGSAVITGILLAFNLPAGLPLWLVIPASLLAILIAITPAGKFGQFPLNGILLSRMMLRIFFPVQMTTWPAVVTSTDSLTGLSPLGMLKEGLVNGKTLAQITSDTKFPGYFDIFWGNVSGSIGEISAIAIVMGGIYLLWKKIITWHTPVAVLGSIFLFESILWIASPGRFMDPVFHLITGGATLFAFFMATDPKTSPVTPLGKLLAGISIGLITIAIRNFGAYPEEMFFAILVVNGFTPFINAKTKITI
jgi:Na+-translocating ferredoxin:NAD+ oxidoreductase subunit D